MAEILHQLIDSLSQAHYLQGLYIPGGAGYQPSTVASQCLREIFQFQLFGFGGSNPALFIWFADA